jgi:hypothetical protein
MRCIFRPKPFDLTTVVFPAQVSHNVFDIFSVRLQVFFGFSCPEYLKAWQKTFDVADLLVIDLFENIHYISQAVNSAILANSNFLFYFQSLKFYIS